MEELTARLRTGKQTNPTKAAPKLFEELHRPQLVASAVIVRAKSRLLLSLVKQLLVVLQELASSDKAIRALFLRHDEQELWRSLPGEGLHLAPRRFSAWGEDRSRYADAGSRQTLAGTAPVPCQSGHYAKAHTRVAWVKPRRNARYQFAWQSTRQEAWAASYYQRKRAEGKSHSRAVRALANVWGAQQVAQVGEPDQLSARDL